MHLTPEQEAALTAIRAETREAVLVGPAGTGKTTCLRELTGSRTVLAAPTGKAAVRLTQATGQPARTLHSLLYRGADDEGRELVFTDPQPPCEPGETLIVDEASMVGAQLYDDVMSVLPRSARVVWVGDREQLEPVRDTWGPDLARPTAELTEVHRQAAGNPIIQYATAIRQGAGGRWRSRWDADDERLRFWPGDVDQVVAWLAQRLQEGADATAITFTHRTRERINAGVRRALGHTADLIVPGDRLLCRMNDTGLGVANGEVFTAERVDRTRRGWRIRFREGFEAQVLEELLNTRGNEAYQLRRRMGRGRWGERSIIHVWHGFCLTVHSAQGSQWDEVAFARGPALLRMARSDRDAARRLAYTAVTRAAEKLVNFAA